MLNVFTNTSCVVAKNDQFGLNKDYGLPAVNF